MLGFDFQWAPVFRSLTKVNWSTVKPQVFLFLFQHADISPQITFREPFREFSSGDFLVLVIETYCFPL